MRLVDKLIHLHLFDLRKYLDPHEFIDLDDNKFLFELKNAVNLAAEQGHDNLTTMFSVILQQIPLEIHRYRIDDKHRNKSSAELETIISEEIGVDSFFTFVLGANQDQEVGYRMFGREFRNYQEALASEYFTQLTGLTEGIDKTGLNDPDFVYYVAV